MIRLSLEIGQTQKPEAILFYILAPLAVLASLGMLVVKKQFILRSYLHG